MCLAVRFFPRGRVCFGLDEDSDLPSCPASAAALVSPAPANPSCRSAVALGRAPRGPPARHLPPWLRAGRRDLPVPAVPGQRVPGRAGSGGQGRGAGPPARLSRQRPGCPTISKTGKKTPKPSKPPKLHFTPWFRSASAVGYGLYKSAVGDQKAPRWS